MNKNEKNKVFIISGPSGVGKSTTSKNLVKRFKKSAYISGDYVSHMHINGRKKPWECEVEKSLIWDNILSLTKNFIQYGNDVVIDYVTFPQEAEWLSDNLKTMNVEIKYIVLWADNETLISRDNMRIPKYRMGERCLILVEEFMESKLDEKYFCDTSNEPPITNVVDKILNNPKYMLT